MFFSVSVSVSVLFCVSLRLQSLNITHMATGNLFLGTARKKIGDIVMYRRNGKQMSRVRVTPSNPRTDAQNVQRMVFSTLSVAGAELSAIVDHSFEGVKAGQTSRNHFIRINNAMARAAVADGTGGYLIKGAKAVAPLPVVISTGSLELDFGFDTANNAALLPVSSPSTLETNISNADDYRAVLGAIGFAPGEQFSIIAVWERVQPASGDAIKAASYGDAYNVRTSVTLHRVVFKRAEDVDYSTPFPLCIEDEGTEMAQFAPQIIDYARTSNWVGNIAIGGAATGMIFAPAGSIRRRLDAIAVVRSSYDDARRDWRYSPAQLMWSNETGIDMGVCTADLVAPSYGDAASEVTSDYYLQQADNLGSGVVSDDGYAPQVLTITTQPATPYTYNESGRIMALTLSDGAVWTEDLINSIVLDFEGIAVQSNNLDDKRTWTDAGNLVAQILYSDAGDNSIGMTLNLTPGPATLTLNSVDF